MSRQVNVVAHTHWDREWYRPFPVFRMQLVELLDGLLDLLEGPEAIAHFQLDGQMALIDDYLEIRPQARPRLKALNRSGQISMGPWYTLPDEFLVSGETLVRNLRLGLERAEAFGGAMPVGYLPDMFGHVAQMPQILTGFGLTDAVVWRGVPADIDAPAFRWRAPDGSEVRAEYLSEGYSNGARLPDSGEALQAQVDAFVSAHRDRVGDPVLWMNGTDHLLPHRKLEQVTAAANSVKGGHRFRVGSLADHLAQVDRDGLPTWDGELRSGARANLLMGVASARVDVKQAAASAERWLERVAEPLTTLWFGAHDVPREFLDSAWLEMIRNAAHDSICGCSTDAVNDVVLTRYAAAEQVARALVDRALIRILAGSGEPAVIVNPSARPRRATVPVVLDGEIPPPDTQQVAIRPALERGPVLPVEAAVAVLVRAVADDPRVSNIEIAEGPDTELVATIVADRQPPSFDRGEMRDRLASLAHDHPGVQVRVDTRRRGPTQEVLLRTPEIAGFGWSGLASGDLGDTAVRVAGLGLTNGIITVEADQGDGTFSVNGLEGFGRLVDDGDAGDTYNWSPPDQDQVVQRPDDVDVTLTEAGPVRGRLEIARTYRWPTHVHEGARVGEAEVRVLTTVELHAGEDLVRVSVEFDNPARDHRLRFHLPLPERTATSEAECAFGTVTRPLTAEGGPNEVGLATYPSRRFVRAGGLVVAHDGLTEYELVDRDDGASTAGEMAITLLRSVGVISQGPMTMRALPAGPSTPTPGAQLPGYHRADLVIHLGDRDPFEVADEAFTPVLTARGPGAPSLVDRPRSGTPLTVTGAEVSAVTRGDDGRIHLRVVNPTDSPTVVQVAGRRGHLVDLRSRPTGETFDETLGLAPWRIATLALDDEEVREGQ